MLCVLRSDEVGRLADEAGMSIKKEHKEKRKKRKKQKKEGMQKIEWTN